jgi:tight adherence protein C
MLPASIPFQTALIAAVLLCGTACAVLLLASGRRDRLRQRIAFVSQVHGRRDSTAQDTDLRWHHRIGAFLAESPLIGSSEFEKIGTALAQAGFRSERAGFGFVTIKFLCFVGAVMVGGLLGLALGWLQDLSLLEISGLLAAGLLGWRAPDLVLSRIRLRRRRRIERGLSDAIDLLVICAEAGLSLEMGLERVRRDLQQAHPGLSEELQITIAEMRLLADRRLALENLVTRTGLAAMRSIVTTLSQTLRYGTPLAASLRTIAAELRQARMLRIEERVGRLPVLLTLPMIVFILPCLFLVIAGPAAFDLIDVINAG